jgi:spore maturation protein CgeB
MDRWVLLGDGLSATTKVLWVIRHELINNYPNVHFQLQQGILHKVVMQGHKVAFISKHGNSVQGFPALDDSATDTEVVLRNAKESQFNDCQAFYMVCDNNEDMSKAMNAGYKVIPAQYFALNLD